MASADNGVDSSRSAAKRSAVDGPAIAPVDTAFHHDIAVEQTQKVRRVAGHVMPLRMSI